MDYEEYQRKALEPIVNYIESAMASYSKEELEARIKKALPEKESEDERIRKKLFHTVLGTPPSDEWFEDISKDKMLAYLERQKDEAQKQFNLGVQAGREEVLYEIEKEQKPAEWSEEDETAFGDLMWCIEQARKSAKDENDMGNIWFAENWVKNRLKSLRPQPSGKCPHYSEGYGCDISPTKVCSTCDKNPQPHWKPSEEQMEALDTVYKTHYMSPTDKSTILNLLNDLKKLM